MSAADGKMRLTDVANTEQLLRIIQSIPSKKAEPFKLWLAETAAKNISQVEKPSTFDENKSAAVRGGRIAGNARKELEAEIGHTVISNQNAVQINSVVTNLIEGIASEDEEDKE